MFLLVNNKVIDAVMANSEVNDAVIHMKLDLDMKKSIIGCPTKNDEEYININDKKCFVCTIGIK